MVTLNMVDKMGFGIHNLNHKQRERYLPLPDYDLSDMQTVKMTVYGSVVDEAYTKVLMQNTDLMFEEVIALDRVQKKTKINDKISKKLLNKGLIEGRKPNYYVSAYIAKVTKKEAEYGRNKPFHDPHYQDMIIRFIEEYGSASRNQIESLIIPVLSPIFPEKRKIKSIDNFLQKLRKQEKIYVTGRGAKSIWKIKDLG
jgi:ATP-dependent DNA helicase RecG